MPARALAAVQAGAALVAGAAGAGCRVPLVLPCSWLLSLVLLRLARRAAAKPVWRVYLPEVPPA